MQTARLASLLAVIALGIAFTGGGLAFADSGTKTLDPSVFGTEIALGIMLGGLAALLGWLSGGGVWSHAKLAYTVITSTIVALGVINSQFGGNVTNENLVQIILAVLGAGLLTNKGVQIAAKLRSRTK